VASQRLVTRWVADQPLAGKTAALATACPPKF